MYTIIKSYHIWNISYLYTRMLNNDVYNFIAITISFNESTYFVNEAARYAYAVLVLSNPSSTNITVKFRSTDDSATGEYT